MREEYEEWLRTAAEGTDPWATEAHTESTTQEAELAPQPDDPDGEITLERQKQETAQ
jgi:hypothetical protein